MTAQTYRPRPLFHSAPFPLLTHSFVGKITRTYRERIYTRCWANINARGSSHAIHAHPNNFLSGVYYVKTQAGADTINFHDPRVQAAVIRPPVTALTGQNTDQVVVRVRNGTLLLFPAYLHHSVGPNASDEDRISISFNVMFSAFAETLSKPMW